MVLLQKEPIDTCELSADALAADFFFPDNPIIPETWMLEYSPAVGLLMVAVTFSFHPKIDSSAKHSFYCLVGMAVVYYQTSSMWWLGHCSWLLCLRPSLPTLSVKYTISPPLFFFLKLERFYFLTTDKRWDIWHPNSLSMSSPGLEVAGGPVRREGFELWGQLPG